MTIKDRILKLTKQLYPTGRAFKFPVDGTTEAFHKGLAVSEAQFYDDAKSLLYSLLADNANFTTDDASDWERRLGLIDGTGNTLNDRMAAIRRKLAAPGINPAKQHYLWIEKQLQDAAFNVYVYENRFPSGGGYITQDPVTVCGSTSILTTFQCGDGQHGDKQHGGGLNNKVVNYLDKDLDFVFNEGALFKHTFFIGGSPIGTFANVPALRETEFRQLILKLKPAHTVAYLFINFV
jgi:uncharacterized protein YmfQ (DUF2313 family)